MSNWAEKRLDEILHNTLQPKSKKTPMLTESPVELPITASAGRTVKRNDPSVHNRTAEGNAFQCDGLRAGASAC